MYDLDGTFRGGPGLATQGDFDRGDPDHDLLQARVEEWSGWVFVNASGDAKPFRDHIGTVDGLMSVRQPEEMFVGATHHYELAANWKVIGENYHECYHCSEIHPELCKISLPGSGDHYESTGTVIGGSMTLLPHAETMSFDGKSLGVPFAGLSGTALREVHYLQLFPNLLLSIHPDYVMTHRLEPVAPDRTKVECAWLFPNAAKDKPGFDPSYAVDFWDLTNRQDWAACESVTRGMAGRGYRQAPLSDQELCVYRSMSMVARGYLEGRIAPVAQAARAALVDQRE
jgi:Rieske 2Fe-2S family protein